MSLRVALVIDGDQTGAKQALEDTATGIGKVETAAGKANEPVRKLPEALKETAAEAGNAEAKVEDLGSAAESAGPKFGSLRTLAIGAIGGIAGALATAALEYVIGEATGAFVGFVQNIVSSGPQVQAALEGHEGLIKRIKGAYEEAEGAASSYGNNSVALLQFEATQNQRDLQSAFERQTGELSGLLGGMRFGSRYEDGGLVQSPLADLVRSMLAEIRAGTPDVIAFRQALAELGNATPEENEGLRNAIGELLDQTQEIAATQAELARSGDLLRAATGNAEAAATALGGAAENYTALGTAAGGAIANLTVVNNLLGSINGRQNALPQSQAVPGLDLGFAGGGWTGGRREQVRGVVHGEEYVVKAGPAAKHFGLLEAINNDGQVPGYASGGYVGATPTRGGFSASGMVGSNPLAALLGGFSDLTGLIEGARGATLSFFRDLDRAQRAGKSGWDAWGDAVNNVLSGVARKAQDMIVNGVFDLVLGAVTGNFGAGLFGGGLRLGYQAGVGHGGAIIGNAPASRLVDASVFANAPRHHSGTPALGRGEVPFIGMEGEEIGWPQDLARKYGSKIEFHLHNYAAVPVTGTETETARGGKRVDVAIGEAVGRAISTPRGPAQRALGQAGQLVSR